MNWERISLICDLREKIGGWPAGDGFNGVGIMTCIKAHRMHLRSGIPEVLVVGGAQRLLPEDTGAVRPAHPEYIVNGGFSIEDGSALKKLLKEQPQITAVMCVNDTLAIGCNAAARELGLSVPEDLSVFGVDGVECLKYSPGRLQPWIPTGMSTATGGPSG